MSQIKTQQPVIHIPSFTRYSWPASQYVRLLKEKGIDCFPETDDFVLDLHYYLTDIEGWAKVLPDLVVNSSLYKPNIYDCEDFGLKAQVTCAERYGLNALRLCIGLVPNPRKPGEKGWHGFNLFPVRFSDRVELMLFEPNDGFEWAGNAFDIGKNGYTPKTVFISKPSEEGK